DRTIDLAPMMAAADLDGQLRVAGALEVVGFLGAARGEDVVAVGGDRVVVFDADAAAAELGRRGLVVEGDVEAGLDGDDHAGGERARLAVAGVGADVVDVEAEPVR